MPEWVTMPKNSWDRAMKYTERALKWVIGARDDPGATLAMSQELANEIGLDYAALRRLGAVTMSELRASSETKTVDPMDAWMVGFLTGTLYERANDHENEMHDN